eukprot:TRINITY_DN38681_c0_g2_i1.p1 TRINITY_DN38681_c0_g2~~TRINITY_DN38681_c0_g2_i1.p1  ORF type:complete len:107 (-),score=30.83 TRINITY_DN38681_c0_g2_i1:77-397(-)
MVASSLDKRVSSITTSPLSTTSTSTATGSGVKGGAFDGTMGGMVISSSSSQPSSPTTAITSPNTTTTSVSYTHLRAHETPEHLVCRLLLEKKKKYQLFKFGVPINI